MKQVMNVLNYTERHKFQHLVWLAITFFVLIYIVSFEQFALLSADSITGLFYQFGGYARHVFILLFFITIFIPYLRPVFFLAAGMTFGVGQGLFVAIIAELLANITQLNFLAKQRDKTIAKLQSSPYKHLQTIKKPFWWLIQKRNIPDVPHDIQQWVISLQNLREAKLVLALLLAALPTAFILVFMGNSIFFFGERIFVVTITLFIVYTLTQLILVSIHHKKQTK